MIARRIAGTRGSLGPSGLLLLLLVAATPILARPTADRTPPVFAQPPFFAPDSPSAAPFAPIGAPDAARRPQITRPGDLADNGESTPAKKKPKRSSRGASTKSEKKAGAASRKGSAPAVSLKALGEYHSIYDDNIFRFSDENLLAYRRGETPWKFGMDTYDDFILSPRLTVDLGRKLIGSKETTFRVKYTLWRYASNPDKSNDQWMLRLRQPLRARDAVELSYTYAPPAYIRNLSDRPPYESRAVPLVWMPFKGTRNAFALAYSGRLSSRLSYRAEAGRVLRFYNKPFLENDNWEWNGAGTATVKLAKRWSVAGKYQYANSVARGRDTTTETKETSDDGDGSYERDLYQGTIGFSPAGALWKVELIELMGQQQVYWYTSRRPYFDDPTHTGRKDTVKVVELTAGTKPVYGPVTLEVGWRQTRRSSTSAATVVGADDIEEDKKYTNNRVWLGMAYPF